MKVLLTILISFIFIDEIKSLWSLDCRKNNTVNIIKCYSGPSSISTIDAKLCDGHNNCVDSKDESPTYCGTGCQVASRGSTKIINCGSKIISLQNAVNLASISSNSHVNNGGINVTDNFVKCNGRTLCKLTFTTEKYDYAIVAFQCIDPKQRTTVRQQTSYIIPNTISYRMSTQITIANATMDNMDNTITKDKNNNIEAIVAGTVCGVLVIAIVVVCLLVRRLFAAAKSKRKTKDIEDNGVGNTCMDNGLDVINVKDFKGSIPPLSTRSSTALNNCVNNLLNENRIGQPDNKNTDNYNHIGIKHTDLDTYDQTSHMAKRTNVNDNYDHLCCSPRAIAYDVSSLQVQKQHMSEYDTLNNKHI